MEAAKAGYSGAADAGETPQRGGMDEASLPDNALQHIVALVRPPFRKTLRLVCSKFRDLEAVTRTRLVFRVLRSPPSAPSSPGAHVGTPCLRVAGGEALSDAGERSSLVRDAVESTEEAAAPSPQEEPALPRPFPAGIPLLPENAGPGPAGLEPACLGPAALVPAWGDSALLPGPLEFDPMEKHPVSFGAGMAPLLLAHMDSTQSSCAVGLSDTESSLDSRTPSRRREREGSTTGNGRRRAGSRPDGKSSAMGAERWATPSDGEQSEDCRSGRRQRQRVGLSTAAPLAYEDSIASQETGHRQQGDARVHPSAHPERGLLQAAAATPSAREAGCAESSDVALVQDECTQTGQGGRAAVQPRGGGSGGGSLRGGATSSLRYPSPQRALSASASPSTPGSPMGTWSPLQGPALFPMLLSSRMCSVPSQCCASSAPSTPTLRQGGTMGSGDERPDEMLGTLLAKFTRIRVLDIYNLSGGSSPGLESADAKVLQVVAAGAPCLEELLLSGQTLGCTVSDEGLEAVSRGCPKLRKLVVHHWVVGKRGMAALADAGRLQELEMDFFARDHANGRHHTVQEVARCHSLTSLHLRYCSDDDIRTLSQGCPALARLTLLFSVLGSGCGELGRNCRALKELTLRSCDTPPFEDPISSLAAHCTSLTSLSLHAGHATTEAGLLRILEANPNLTRLSLEFKPVPLRLSNVAPRFAGLRELTLQWVQADDADLIALSRHCQGLSILVLSMFKDVTDEGVIPLLRGCGASLEVLSLRINNATDESLRVLGAACPELQRLTIGLPQATGAGIAAMLRSQHNTSNLCKLRRLRFVDCSALGDDAIGPLAECCPKLEGFGIKGCNQVTHQGLMHLVQSCVRLEHVEADYRYLSPALVTALLDRGIELVEAGP